MGASMANHLQILDKAYLGAVLHPRASKQELQLHPPTLQHPQPFACMDWRSGAHWPSVYLFLVFGWTCARL